MSSTNPGMAAPSPAPGYGALGAGLVVLALVVGAAWIADRQQRRFLSGLDEQRLGQAARRWSSCWRASVTSWCPR